MPELITPEQHRAEVSALNREIYLLSKRLEEADRNGKAPEAPKPPAQGEKLPEPPAPPAAEPAAPLCELPSSEPCAYLSASSTG